MTPRCRRHRYGRLRVAGVDALLVPRIHHYEAGPFEYTAARGVRGLGARKDGRDNGLCEQPIADGPNDFCAKALSSLGTREAIADLHTSSIVDRRMDTAVTDDLAGVEDEPAGGMTVLDCQSHAVLRASLWPSICSTQTRHVASRDPPGDLRGYRLKSKATGL